jgi:hypothetical protein
MIAKIHQFETNQIDYKESERCIEQIQCNNPPIDCVIKLIFYFPRMKYGKFSRLRTAYT